MDLRRLLTRAVLATGLAVAAMTVPAVPASAHAYLESSDPASGAALAESPDTVTLDFNETVSVDLGGVEMTDASGAVVELGEPSQPRDDLVRVGLPDLGDGLYLVTYRVVSADGHPVSGSITFRVGSADGTVTVPAPDDTSSDVVGALHGLTSIAGLVALVLSAGLALVSLTIHDLDRSVRLIRGAAIALAIITATHLVISGPYLAGTGLADAVDPGVWADLVGTAPGRWWLIRIAVSVLLAVVIGRERGRNVALGAAAAMAVSVALDGHATVGPRAFLGGTASVLHVLAQCVWLGGLVVMLRGDGVPRRWSSVAATCVALLAATGVAQAWRLLDSWEALVDTDFGQLLLVKTTFVAVMLGAALLARRALGHGGLRRAVAGELAVGLGVLVVTGVLVGSSYTVIPESAVDASSPTTSSSSTTSVVDPVTLELEEGGRQLTVVMSGTTIGRHSATVTLDDSNAPLSDPLTVRGRIRPRASVDGAIAVEFSASGPRQWEAAGIELAAIGEWTFEVIIDDTATSLRFSIPIDVER